MSASENVNKGWNNDSTNNQYCHLHFLGNRVIPDEY